MGYHFHKLPKNLGDACTARWCVRLCALFRQASVRCETALAPESVPEHHHFTFFGGFCRSGDHHFQNFFNFNPFIAIASHGRLSPNMPNAKHSAAPQVSGRSGDSHFHAQSQNGSSSFRSPAFSRSKRLKLVPEPQIFTLKTAQARSGAPNFQAQNGSRVWEGDYQNSAHNPCKQCRSGVVFSKVLSDPVIFKTLWSIISLLDEPFSLNVGAIDF